MIDIMLGSDIMIMLHIVYAYCYVDTDFLEVMYSERLLR